MNPTIQSFESRILELFILIPPTGGSNDWAFE